MPSAPQGPTLGQKWAQRLFEGLCWLFTLLIILMVLQALSILLTAALE